MEIGAADRGRIIALSFRFLMFLNGIFFFFDMAPCSSVLTHSFYLNQGLTVTSHPKQARTS
ncbi:hypothetical protein BDV37DRAFT_40593 [Aspergillus pseudonomiae]|uniref:Uncharacterized protein n=1 Tax=Aspergillus pseudonomiae TaxID=1506151 RepID=A0A5N7DM24_9EURO|nr:uncharacterized protein BDV37DRAFT_40593 [Aspergillus pseudonomiae]KAE8407099.1 hypothetical protein BDV37DRAFT_40593 [Aspergillus pseudonomiae]